MPRATTRTDRMNDWQRRKPEHVFVKAAPPQITPDTDTKELALRAMADAEKSPYAGRWKCHSLSANPHVVLYGSSYCSCCTRLRARLELAGWRYRWVELNKKRASLLVGKRDWKDWKGTLPVIVVNGIWLEVGNSEFFPWPISNPKRRKDIIIGSVEEVGSET